MGTLFNGVLSLNGAGLSPSRTIGYNSVTSRFNLVPLCKYVYFRDLKCESTNDSVSLPKNWLQFSNKSLRLDVNGYDLVTSLVHRFNGQNMLQFGYNE